VVSKKRYALFNILIVLSGQNQGYKSENYSFAGLIRIYVVSVITAKAADENSSEISS
jgi:hypothetical protein